MLRTVMQIESQRHISASTPTCIGRRYSRMTVAQYATNVLIITLDLDLATPDTTGAPGSNKTDFATSGSTPLDRRSFTDVLMVTTSVRMLHGVHSHTSHNRPAVPLSLVLVVGATRLENGLVDTTTSGDDACNQTRLISKAIQQKELVRSIMAGSVTASSEKLIIMFHK